MYLLIKTVLRNTYNDVAHGLQYKTMTRAIERHKANLNYNARKMIT